MMKRSILYICTMLLIISCTGLGIKENPKSDYAIIPKPQKMTPLKGRFSVNSKVVIVANANLTQEAQLLKTFVGGEIVESALKNAIKLEIDTSIINEEGYKLSIESSGILISGKTAKGVFYGIQTLRQLMPVGIETSENKLNKFSIPAVTIEDSPRFVYRGMHLDVARHFFPVDFVKKYIDLIAMHKMNTFHWHLTEDQGWRIEIKKHPRLTEIGAWRNGTIVGHHPGKENDQKKYGGFYTQEEVKEIVAYAAERHITVIPEIELPGHSSAAIAAYPYLSCFPNEKTTTKNDVMSKASKNLQEEGISKMVQEDWGVFPDVYCAGKEDSFKFLEDVLTEVISLFPSSYIHIGGDECPKSNWKKCPNCQDRIKKEGLHDEHELQSYFITRMEKFLNSKGKNIIGWDEILEGGLAPNATVMSWRGTKGGIAAAKEHHNVIMTPGHSCYFDHYQVKSKEAKKVEPLAIGGNTTVANVYAYEPVPKELNAEEQKFILGAQGNVWTEYMGTSDYVEYMILPRMSALSEVVWSAKNGKDYNEFLGRLRGLSKRFDVLGLNYARHAFIEIKKIEVK